MSSSCLQSKTSIIKSINSYYFHLLKQLFELFQVSVNILLHLSGSQDMNIKFILFLFSLVIAFHARKKNGNGTINRKSRYLLVKVKEENGNKKSAAESLFLSGKFYQQIHFSYDKFRTIFKFTNYCATNIYWWFDFYKVLSLTLEKHFYNAFDRNISAHNLCMC